MSDINPYAPPTVLDPPVKPDPGVGVWRDGSLFVTHRAANLPPVCVKTGLPAVGWIDMRFTWFDLLPMHGRLFTMRVPLSKSSLWGRRQGTWISIGVAAIAFAILPVLVGLPLPTTPLLHQSLVYVDVIVGLIAVFCAITCWHILGMCRMKRDYFWFAGAHRRFLEQLPPWPGI